jgi:type IV secretory pathway VirB6-like protein
MVRRYLRLLTLVLPLVVAVCPLVLPEAAQAAAPSQVCTNFPDRALGVTAATGGILTNITDYVKDIIYDATVNLYTAFTGSVAYQRAVYAAATLMIVIFGVAFTIGVVQASFGEVLRRMVKLGIIFTLISPTGWFFFSDYAVRFFNDGTDELIGGVMSIGTGIPYIPCTSPFLQLDGLAGFILHPDTIVAVLGSMGAGGPYGMMMGSFLGVAVFGLLKMILDALRLYAVSFVVRSLLLGVAPVFIVFLMFDRTKQLFTSWLNSMINLSLQPILYFTFIAFFIVMLQTAAVNMLNGELCWGEFASVSGSQNKTSFWRFATSGAPNADEMNWKGSIACQLSATPPAEGCKEFPLNVLDILSFLILVYVASKFSSIVERMSAEISSAFVNLDAGGRMALGIGEKTGGGGGGGGGPMGSSNTGGAGPSIGGRPNVGDSGGGGGGRPSSAPQTARPQGAQEPPPPRKEAYWKS